LRGLRGDPFRVEQRLQIVEGVRGPARLTQE
jgi:hypothetical protein